MYRSILAIFAAILVAVTAVGVSAQKPAKKKEINTGKELKAAVDRVDKASDVINGVMKVSERAIPRDLLEKAKAVVVFPGTLKAAFIVGGQGGKGVAIRRTATGWSAPAFVNMAGGSFGLQAGGQKTDYILVIMNDKGLANLLEDRFEIGGEGSIAAGPIGRSTSASTNATLDSQILSYSRTKGLFAGIALKGVVITQDADINQAVYQRNAKEIIGNPPLASTEAPKPLQKLGETITDRAR